MLTRHKNTAALVFVFVFSFFYYTWITLWPAHEYIRTLGGNIFSVIGPLIATYWLIGASKRSPHKDKPFWLLLAAGTFSYVIAEVIWLIYENILLMEVPYPGIPDIFYSLNLVFYLIAFGYKLKIEKEHLSIAKFVFDIFLVMTVYTTFFWYFLIRPVIERGSMSLFELAFSLFYPLGNLALLFFISILYFAGHSLFQRYTTIFLLSGVLFQIIGDVGFLLMQYTDSYSSNEWIDPLFISGILFIGYTGLLQKESFPNETNNLLIDESSSKFRLLFPYVYVAILFVYMIINATMINEVTIGAAFTILIIIARQLIVLIENKRLIHKYEAQTTNLILSEERYKSLFDHHPDAVFSLDLKGHVLSVNTKGEDLLGVKRKNLISQSIMRFVDDEHKEKIIENFYNTKYGISQYYESTITNNFGRFLYINVTHIPIMVKKELVGIFVIAQDVTQNKLNEQRIHHMAYHDALTSLANRSHFEELLANQIKQTEKGQDPFAVLFMDLNNFKKMNDTYGHAFGDDLLSQIGQRILSSLKDSDHAARLGGDEFTLLLTGLSTREGVLKHIGLLLDTLSQPYQINGEELTSIPSIGFSLYPEDGTSVQDLLKHADDAMYKNKRRSKEQ